MWADLTGVWQGVSSRVSAKVAPLLTLTLKQCLPASDVQHEHVVVNGRRFRVLSLLAEGGYAYVHLVEEVHTGLSPAASQPQLFALKKVLVSTNIQLVAAKQEIATLRQLSHPNLLPLLDASINTPRAGRGQGAAWRPDTLHAYMLFPYYQGGNLWDVVRSRMQQGDPLPQRDALAIFIQICAALQAMHSMEPALAHRDVKPLNVLLQPRGSSSAAGGGGTAGGPTGGHAAGEYHAVLIDFGSTRPARHQVSSRLEALTLQEDAEAHCTAAYRAPELWDPPSTCSLDERVDVWSAGCLLYFMLAGESPFERVAGAGGSLMLAVSSGRVRWPPETEGRCSQAVRDLVMLCLNTDPAARPFVAAVQQEAERVAMQLAT